MGSRTFLISCSAILGAAVTIGHAGSLTLSGVQTVPHVHSAAMRYRQKADFHLGARVEVFLQNPAPATPLP